MNDKIRVTVSTVLIRMDCKERKSLNESAISKISIKIYLIQDIIPTLNALCAISTTICSAA